ncbi:MAG TPA: SCP2 sterol-binding domain-containing protein [Chthoniobacterales bacterium]|nr:SCP2 sterol-binding domain-containing protein [Chthoniobacterales bacterium]
MKLGILLVALVVTLSASGAVASKPGNSATPQDVFDAMRRGFDAERAKGVHARFQFDLSGPNGGLWWVEVDDAKCKMGRGRIQSPGVTFVASDADWVELSNGTLAGWWAYLTGRLKIRGDQNLARKLGEIFN